MTAYGVVAVVVASACSPLLDLEPGTPVFPEPPGCATGWSYRVPIDIENVAGASLSNHQVAIPLDLGGAIAAGKLSANGGDLRFGLNDHTPPLAFAVEGDLARAGTRAWVELPTLSAGTTRIYEYYGNPAPAPWERPSPFVEDVLRNPSFEDVGSWTIDTNNRVFAISSAWASDGQRSLSVDAYRAETTHDAQDFGVTQIASFPPGSNYVLEFDVDVIAASNGGITGASNGSFLVSAGNGLVRVWSLSGDAGNITGDHRNVETAPFGPGSVGILFGVTLNGGFTPAYAKGFFDNIRIRRHVTPEPEVRVGQEENACAP